MSQMRVGYTEERAIALGARYGGEMVRTVRSSRLTPNADDISAGAAT